MERSVADLTEFLEESGSSKRSYFIGTVVVAGSQEEGWEILDGQQRLATLTMLLSVLTERYHALDMGAAAHYEAAGLFRRNPRGSYQAQTPYITLNQYDGEFFRKVVIDRKKDEKPRFESHKLIKKAMESFGARVDEYVVSHPTIDPATWLDQLCDTIINRVLFVYVQSDPTDSHQVFRVLNDRGKGLSQLDLFRTFLLQKAAPEARDTIAESWTEILDIQTPGSPEDLLRFYWVTQRGDVKSRKLFRDIEDAVKKGAKTAEDLATDLFFFCDIYEYLIAPSVEGTPERSSLLRSVADLKAKALYPLLMAAKYREDNNDISSGDFLRILKLALAVYVRHTVIGHRDNYRLETVAYESAKDMFSAGSADAVVAKLKDFARDSGLTDERFVEDFKAASIPNEGAAKSLLRAIESKGYNIAERAVPLTGALHLEHIYPKKPKEKFVDHDDYISRLGNLTLVDGTLNRKMQNFAFEQKKARYAESQIEMTKSLCSLDAWGKEEIVGRQVSMAEAAQFVWSVD